MSYVSLRLYAITRGRVYPLPRLAIRPLLAWLCLPALLLAGCAEPDPPPWVNFSPDPWPTLTPAQAGLDPEAFRAFLDHNRDTFFPQSYGGQRPVSGGVVLARGGYVIQTWGDPDYRYQNASLGKQFSQLCFQLAVDDGLIHPDDPIAKHWDGEGLTGHKRLDQGFHPDLTFRHLVENRGGFPVGNGYWWATRSDSFPGIPEWAEWTGDAEHDSYSQIPPGSQYHYASGNYWRLSQALTAIWRRPLKDVLDERIMGPIGIPPDHWDWIDGRTVKETVDFYPELPGYGDFLDPPFEIHGIPVQGGGGWVVMSARDLARLGLLVATGGVWGETRLVSEIQGGTSVSANSMKGWGRIDGRNAYISLGRVQTGFRDPGEDDVTGWVSGPPRPPARTRATP